MALGKMKAEYIDAVTLFTSEDKEFFLSDPNVIDKGIKDLADAINSVKVFTTMNSCQGFLIESESAEHCPKAYVDFYVLEHQYHIANMLLTLLTNVIGSALDCSLSYEADFNLISDDEVEDNGFVNYRYRIEFMELKPEFQKNIYEETVDYIKKFAKDVNY